MFKYATSGSEFVSGQVLKTCKKTFLILIVVLIQFSPSNNSTIPRSRVLLDKVLIAQPVKKLPAFFRTREVQHLVHNSPPLIPIPIQMNPVFTLPHNIEIILILLSHLCLCLPNGLFPSHFPTKLYNDSSYLPCLPHAPPTLIILDLIILITGLFTEGHIS